LNPSASTIREEKAKIGPVALITLASLISISKNLTTHARIFEDECCSYISDILRKRRRFNKHKGCSFALENTVKLAFFCMGAVFKSEFLKIFTEFKKTHARKMKN